MHIGAETSMVLISIDGVPAFVRIIQNGSDDINRALVSRLGMEPAQAEQIVDILWERRLPHAYLLFPGEDHGFRSAANVIRSFEAELSFYGQVFGFEPAGAIEPIEVEFLGGAPDAAGRRRASGATTA